MGPSSLSISYKRILNRRGQEYHYGITMVVHVKDLEYYDNPKYGMR